VVLVGVVMLVVELPDVVRLNVAAVVRGDPAALDGLPTSRVSNSSSPKLLDAVLLGGDFGVLRWAGADRRRGVYPYVNNTLPITHTLMITTTVYLAP